MHTRVSVYAQESERIEATHTNITVPCQRLNVVVPFALHGTTRQSLNIESQNPNLLPTDYPLTAQQKFTARRIDEDVAEVQVAVREKVSERVSNKGVEERSVSH
jgi:hypothetical protein